MLDDDRISEVTRLIVFEEDGVSPAFRLFRGSASQTDDPRDGRDCGGWDWFRYFDRWLKLG